MVNCATTSEEAKDYVVKVFKYFTVGNNIITQLKTFSSNGMDFLASITLANRAIDEENDYYAAGK